MMDLSTASSISVRLIITSSSDDSSARICTAADCERCHPDPSVPLEFDDSLTSPIVVSNMQTPNSPSIVLTPISEESEKVVIYLRVPWPRPFLRHSIKGGVWQQVPFQQVTNPVPLSRRRRERSPDTRQRLACTDGRHRRRRKHPIQNDPPSGIRHHRPKWFMAKTHERCSLRFQVWSRRLYSLCGRGQLHHQLLWILFD